MVVTKTSSSAGERSATVRTSEYGPILARVEYASMRADSDYATSIVDVKNLGGSSNYGALTPAEGGSIQ
jgi:hypothetical protein